MGQKSSVLVDEPKISDEWYDYQVSQQAKHIDFDVEAWYKILEKETFHTEFISLDTSTAQAFIDYYQTYYNSKCLLKKNGIKLIQSIQKQLKERISKSTATNFFVRLSSRSPKDGRSLNADRFDQFYDAELNRLSTQYPDESNHANLKMIAISYAQFHTLKTTNEIEALCLILSSERVFVDLLEALACYKVNNSSWNNNIILREWNDRLDPSMEFHCFVYQSKLTAISQYNHYCKFNHLQDADIIQQIKTTIVQYWQTKIQPLLDPFPEKYANYVIDIGLLGIDNFDCIVIEMNPFQTSTGASLFDWRIDNDLLKGKSGNEIEIRVNHDYCENIDNFVEYILKEQHSTSEEPYFTVLNKLCS